MKMAKVCSIVFAYCAFAFASFLSYITGKNPCPLLLDMCVALLEVELEWFSIGPTAIKLQSECRQCVVEKKGN
jgi:hypothetical protein